MYNALECKIGICYKSFASPFPFPLFFFFFFLLISSLIPLQSSSAQQTTTVSDAPTPHPPSPPATPPSTTNFQIPPPSPPSNPSSKSKTFATFSPPTTSPPPPLTPAPSHPPPSSKSPSLAFAITTPTSPTTAPTTSSYLMTTSNILPPRFFSRLVTYPQIQLANNISYANTILVGQRLWIPLPCSYDDVDNEVVVHYRYLVSARSTLNGIAERFNTTKSTLLNLNRMASPSEYICICAYLQFDFDELIV